LAIQNETDEVKKEFVQFTKEALERDVIIAQFERYCETLKSKFEGQKNMYLRLCDDFKS